MNKLIKNGLLGLTVALGFSSVAIAQDVQPRRVYEYTEYRYSSDNDSSRFRSEKRQIIRSATDLQEEANDFFRSTDDLRGFSYLSDDAKDLARDIRDFKQEVRENDHPRFLARDFNQLRNTFHSLQNDFYRTYRQYRDPMALRDFRDLERSWNQFHYTFTGRYDTAGSSRIYGLR